MVTLTMSPTIMSQMVYPRTAKGSKSWSRNWQPLKRRYVVIGVIKLVTLEGSAPRNLAHSNSNSSSNRIIIAAAEMEEAIGAVVVALPEVITGAEIGADADLLVDVDMEDITEEEADMSLKPTLGNKATLTMEPLFLIVK